MAARKKQGNRKRGGTPAGAIGESCVPPAGSAAAPSARQKCLLAAAVVLETFWVAALVAMALAE